MYIAYKNAIETIIKDNLNDIKTVDWFNRQYERYEDLKAVKFPACYIEFVNPVKWQTLPNKVQQATAEIKLHLVVFDIGDSPDKTLILTSDLHKTIQGQRLFDGTEQLSTEFVRTESELITIYDQLKVTILNYKTTLVDCSAVQQTTQIPVNLVVEVKPA